MQALTTEDILSEVHVGMKALLNSSGIIREEERLRSWLAKVVRIDDADDTDLECRSLLWLGLGVDPIVMEELERLNPWWCETTSQR